MKVFMPFYKRSVKYKHFGITVQPLNRKAICCISEKLNTLSITDNEKTFKYELPDDGNILIFFNDLCSGIVYNFK